MPFVPEQRAFRVLERALWMRRLRELDPRLAVEVAALALLLAAVLFWQVRVPLDGWARRSGPLAASAVAAAMFAALAAVCAAFTTRRLGRLLNGALDGPAWLALPCEARFVRRHLEWNARAPLPFFLLAQLALWLALFGLVPLWALLGLGAGGFALAVLGARGGAALGMRLAIARSKRAAPSDAAEVLALASALARRRPERARARKREPAWRASAPLLSVLEHDLRLTRRATSARTRVLAFVAYTLLAALPWFAPWPPALCRALGFGLALLASSAAAEWLIATSALHPFGVLRTLPVGVGTFWGARLFAALSAVTLVVASQLSAARLMSPLALRVHLVWVGAAALAIVVFGANLGVTLYPRADHARRVLALSLALAMTASFILPLAGWVLLLTALLHSARRLPPWTRGELLSCS